MDYLSEAGGRDTPSNADALLTNEQAAAMLGLTPDSLRAYRAPTKARGPRFVKLRNRVYYRRSDVEAYLAAQQAELDALLRGGR